MAGCCRHVLALTKKSNVDVMDLMGDVEERSDGYRAEYCRYRLKRCDRQVWADNVQSTAGKRAGHGGHTWAECCR